MIDANNLRKGVTFAIDNDIYKVMDYTHKKPGRGLATIRVKAVNLRTGAQIEKTFSSSEKVEDIRLEFFQAQFLYMDGDNYVFMNTETYEQPAISSLILGDTANYLKEGMQVKLTFYEGETLDIEIPTSVELTVVKAEASVRGDTATGVQKRVTTETGLELSVPAFIEEGDVIKVDTRTGEYLTRA
ncbi:MAG: elongation factor P [Anaerolineae bacterium]|nr:elongation factor P [Anaerolineae bacterium]